MSEDCLYLNIYTGGVGRRPASRDGLIHGGAHTSGRGRHLSGREELAREGVVVVTVNYRLGVFFGFPVRTGSSAEESSSHSSGNYAFLDQIAARAGAEKHRRALEATNRGASSFPGAAAATSPLPSRSSGAIGLRPRAW